VFHVFARGNDRETIYRDDADRRLYLRLLGTARRRTGWALLSWCLMGTHVHLFVETPTPNLGAGMQWLHGRYARAFNDRHDRVGHLFQGRYQAVRQRTDAQVVQTLRYIARNPVEAGLCTAAVRYPWASHGALLAGTAGAGPAVDLAPLARLLDAPADATRERYAAVVGVAVA
jgi:putative transposase